MYELNLFLWDIFCIRKVQLNLFVQKIQKIQHADSIAAEKSSQSSYYINSCAENLIELKIAVKWACESNAQQNENNVLSHVL